MKQAAFCYSAGFDNSPRRSSALVNAILKGEKATPVPESRCPPPRGFLPKQTRNPGTVITTRASGAVGRPFPLESRSWPISRSHAVMREPKRGGKRPLVVSPRAHSARRARPGGGRPHLPPRNKAPAQAAGSAPPSRPRVLRCQRHSPHAPAAAGLRPSGRLHARAGLTAPDPRARQPLGPVPTPAPP